METPKYIAIQQFIEELEEDNATGKVILFFEDGVLRAIEIDRKVKITV
jgi:hypothetical protein